MYKEKLGVSEILNNYTNWTVTSTSLVAAGSHTHCEKVSSSFLISYGFEYLSHLKDNLIKYKF